MNRYEKDFTIHLGALGEDTYENETGAGIDASEETVEFESPRREEVKSMEEDFMDIRGELSEDDGISAKKGTKAEKESQINEIDLSSPSDANCDSDELSIPEFLREGILKYFKDEFENSQSEEVKSMEEDVMNILGDLFGFEGDGTSGKEDTKAEKESQVNEIDLSSPSDANCDSDEPFIDASKIHPEILQKFLDDFHLKMEDLPYLHSMEDVIELSEIRYRKMHPEIFDKPFSERAARAIYRLHL